MTTFNLEGHKYLWRTLSLIIPFLRLDCNLIRSHVFLRHRRLMAAPPLLPSSSSSFPFPSNQISPSPHPANTDHHRPTIGGDHTAHQPPLPLNSTLPNYYDGFAPPLTPPTNCPPPDLITHTSPPPPGRPPPTTILLKPRSMEAPPPEPQSPNPNTNPTTPKPKP